MASETAIRQRSSNASSLVIGIVRATTLKGVGGESGSGCGSLFLLGCTKAAAAYTKKKGRLRCHKRPKSREETPKEGSDSGVGLGGSLPHPPS